MMGCAGMVSAASVPSMIAVSICLWYCPEVGDDHVHADNLAALLMSESQGDVEQTVM